MAKRKRDKRMSRAVPRQPIARGASLAPSAVAAVAALSIIHFTLAVTSVLDKSNTYDEIAHLTRGYSYRLTHDYRLGPPHPLLVHYWASLGGRLSDVRFTRLDQKAWHESDVWTIGRQFFYFKNLGNAATIDSLLFRGRAMIALWSTALGLIVFFWSRRLFGTAGGLVSLTLFAFSPTMLAHGRLVTTDSAVALFFMCSLASIWWILHRLSPAGIAGSALSLVCLFLAKMSAVLIIPMGLVLLALRVASRRPLPVAFGKHRRAIASRAGRLGCYLAVMVLWIAVVWIGIWGAYGFRYEAMVDAQAGRDRFYSPNPVPKDRTVWEHQLRGKNLSPLAKWAVPWLREHRLLPEAYLYSAAFAAQTARGRNAFLNGSVNIRGFRSFFPYTFLVKTPLPLFGLLVAAVGVPLYKRRSTFAVDTEHQSGSAVAFLYLTSPLWVFFAIYWFASMRSHLNIGHRHIMPTYPVLFILCGATACYLRAQAKPLRAVVPVLTGLFAIASLWSHPHYLSYFNTLVGGSDRAYHHLVDSSLDWGQDLPGLRKYLDARREDGFDGEVFLAYFGSGRSLAVEHFGIEARILPASLSDDATGMHTYRSGLYAISATRLQQVYSHPGDHVWTAKLERQYRKLLPAFEAFESTADTKEARARWNNPGFRKRFSHFQKLMLARLCAYLRPREPDAIVNHTILIFELDAQELEEALEDPLPQHAAQ